MLFLPLLLLAQIPAGYYDSAAGKSGNELKNTLHNIINDHVRYPYTSTSTDVWDILMYCDEDSTNTDNVILLYTGRSQAKSLNASQGSDPDYWNREHVWSKSHGFPNESDTAYTDVHHLRPADASVNSSRSNKDFDNGGEPHSEATECNADSDSWEVRDAVKGDVARMMFYMAVRYEEDGNYDLELVETIPSSGPQFAKLATLLEWHQNDPVDAGERRRNDRVYSYQNNRNPFIDHPEYVDLIWGSASVKEEPSNHVSGFSATGNGLTVDLSWSDGGGAVTADYYLIKGSTTGFSAITDPQDSIAVTDDTDFSDGGAAVNVAYGTTNYTFENLSESSLYYFKIYSFTNSGVNSNYKTDGAIPQDSAETGTSSGATNLFISEYVEGSSYDKYLELYNGTSGSIDLSGYDIQIYYNGDLSPGTTISLSGTLSPGQTFVIAHGSAASWGGSPDLSTSALNFNGNDVVVLRQGSTDIDIIGVKGSSDYLYQDKTMCRSSTITSPSGTYESSEWTEPGLSFDDLGTHNMDNPLPVKVLFFRSSQTGRHVHLQWQTGSEIRNRGFRIFRSDNGGPFTLVAGENVLTGQGNSNAINDYSYRDTPPRADRYIYRLYDLDYDGGSTLLAETAIQFTAESMQSGTQPLTMALNGNVPNPFNSSTQIAFVCDEAQQVELTVYDIRGRFVTMLFRGRAPAGASHVRWNGKNTAGYDVASGVYICVFKSPRLQASQRMLLLR